jgi:hypothetical protein
LNSDEIWKTELQEKRGRTYRRNGDGLTGETGTDLQEKRGRNYRRNGDGLTGETGTELQEKRGRTYRRNGDGITGETAYGMTGNSLKITRPTSVDIIDIGITQSYDVD